MFYILLLECWGQWKALYKKNKKMEFRVNKVKKVLKLNSREYYDHLEKMNQNLMNMKKKTIKANRDSILKTNENKFEIRELPDNPGSNYSSVKKESQIRDDLTSDQQISGKDVPLKMKDFKSFNDKIVAIGNIFVNLKKYMNFDMGNAMILDIIKESKPTTDEGYHNFIMSYKKCFSYGEKGPTLFENNQVEGKSFNWNRMKNDVTKMKTDVDQFYETIQNVLTKKVDFKNAKKVTDSTDTNPFLDFVLEKYIENGSNGELFDSNIKETKSPKKDDFEFNMDDGKDVFASKPDEPEKKPTSFALDQENDAFKGFESKKKKVKIS
jgi:hypothetical protein